MPLVLGRNSENVLCSKNMQLVPSSMVRRNVLGGGLNREFKKSEVAEGDA